MRKHVDDSATPLLELLKFRVQGIFKRILLVWLVFDDGSGHFIELFGKANISDWQVVSEFLMIVEGKAFQVSSDLSTKFTAEAASFFFVIDG